MYNSDLKVRIVKYNFVFINCFIQWQNRASILNRFIQNTDSYRNKTVTEHEQIVILYIRLFIECCLNVGLHKMIILIINESKHY